MTFKKLILFLLLSFFTVTLPVHAAPAAPLEKVTVAQWGQEHVLLYLPFYIAMEEGLFQKTRFGH